MPVRPPSGAAPVLPTAPAYSFGAGHDLGTQRSYSASGGASPGHYDPQTRYLSNFKSAGGTSFGVGAQRPEPRGPTSLAPHDYGRTVPASKSLSYSFGRLLSTADVKKANPAPTKYNVTQSALDMTRKAAPRFSLGSRTELPDDSKRKPGPGTYDANLNAVKASRSFSLKGKLEDPSFKERARKPGPGAYDASDALLRRSNGAFTIYGRLERSDSARLLPGPGAYDARRPSTAPSFSLGSGKDRFKASAGHAPPPGTYFQASVYERSKGFSVESTGRSAPAFSLYGRIPGKDTTDAPGAGTYSPKTEMATKPGTPAYSLGRPVSGPSGLKVPGPGAYDARDASVRKSATSVSIHRLVSVPDDSRNKPGPGTYDHLDSYTRLHKAPGFSIRGKLDTNNKTPSPGAVYDLPGAGGVSYSFGRRLSSANSSRSLPGPGAYEMSATTLGYATRR